MKLGALLRFNSWPTVVATAGLGLAVAPFLLRQGDTEGRIHRLEAQLEASEAQRLTLQDRLDRSLHAVDEASESAHRLEARLSHARSSTRETIAYAQVLEEELRLRQGYGPELERSTAPVALASVDPLLAPEPAPVLASTVAPPPDLPDTTLEHTVPASFLEAEIATTRRVRERLARKSWDEVVMRAVIGECRGRVGQTRFDECESEVTDRLAPYQRKAQQCMAGNFGGTFYFDGMNRSNPPTHGVILERGMVVFCDPNLRDPGDE